VLQGLREVAANKAEPASSRVRSLELLGKERVQGDKHGIDVRECRLGLKRLRGLANEEKPAEDAEVRRWACSPRF
jgi:hypothetical protein